MIPKCKIYKLVINNIIVAEGNRRDIHKARQERGGRVWMTTKKIGERVAS